MRTRLAALLITLGPAVALAQSPWDMGKQAAGGAAVGRLEKEINRRLLDESRKNQCSFKTDSDQLEKGCDPKARRLANAVVDAKKRLEKAGVRNFKFEVSGHTDSSGSAAHNRELSLRRAERIRAELAGKGVLAGDVVAVGAGSDRPLVAPDDTPAKKAKNRRYEVQVRL
jgi:outer membrane protein OmpA-like peptidoglycan-associated protein